MKGIFLLASYLLFPIVYMITGSFWYGLGASLVAIIITHLVADLSINYRVFLYDLDNYRQLPLFKGRGHRNVVMALAISPGNQFVASGAYDNRVLIWDINRNRKLLKITGCKDARYISCLLFSNENNQLYMGCSNGIVNVLDPASGNALFTIQTKAAVVSLRQGPDNRHIYTIENDRPDLAYNHYCMRTYALESGQLTGVIGEDNLFSAAAFTPDRQLLITLHDNSDLNNNSNSQSVVLHDTASGEVLNRTPVSKSSGIISHTFLSLAASDEYMALGGIEKEVCLYSLETLQLAHKLPIQGTVRGLRFSPNGKILAVSSEIRTESGRDDDRAIILFDKDSGAQMLKIDSINSPWGLEMAFSPDGKHFTTAGVKKGKKMFVQ